MRQYTHFYADYSSLYECLKPNNDHNTSLYYDKRMEIKDPTISKGCFEMKK